MSACPSTFGNGLWSAKLVKKQRPYCLRAPLIELRRRIRECDVLIVVQRDPGYRYEAPTYTYQSDHAGRVRLSMNGPLWLESGDLTEIQSVVSEAQKWLDEGLQ